MWQVENVSLKYNKISDTQSVHSAFYTYNHTFVFAFIDSPKKHTAIIHADSKGNILYKKEYQEYLDDCFHKLSEQQVVIGPYKGSTFAEKIQIIDLKTYETVSFQHANYFKSSGSDHFSILHCFPQSGYLGIVDYNSHEDRELSEILEVSIKYYDPTKLRDHICELDPILIQGIRQALDNIVKVNRQSKFSVIQERLKIQSHQIFSFTEVGINQKQSKVESRQLTINKIDNLPSTLNKLYLCSIQQIQKNKYMLEISDKKQFLRYSRHICFAEFKEDGSLDKAKKLYTEDEGIELEFIVSGNMLIVSTDRYFMGSYNSYNALIIRIDSGEAISKLVVPISPLLLCISRIDSAEMFLQFKEKKKSPYVCDFIVTKLALKWTKGEIAMFFLLHINEDFDDDLLMDAYELLSSSLLEQEIRINESLEPRLICKELTIEENPYNFKL